MQVRMLMTLLTLSVLAGCAAQDKREPPNWNDIKLPETAVTYPDPLPLLCVPYKVEDTNGNEHVAWTGECWNYFAGYEEVAKTNTTLAHKNAGAALDMKVAATSTVTAATMQQNLTDYYADLLKDERRGRFWDGIMYKVLIGLGLVVLP